MKKTYSTKIKTLLWVLQILAAAILLQTLRFKFTGSVESVELFSALGMEHHGRIITGVVELIAGIALLIWRFSASGALISAGLMVGAMFAHAWVLGFDFLFGMAVFVFLASLLVAYIRRFEIPFIGKML